MVNSGSYDSAGNDGDSCKGEFTQLEEQVTRAAASPRHIISACSQDTNLTATTAEMVTKEEENNESAANSNEEREIGLKDMTLIPSENKTSLQCSVPLYKVKDVLGGNYNNILENLLKKKSDEQKIQKRLLCLFCDRTFTSTTLKQKHVDRCHSSGQSRRSSSRTPHSQSATACCFCPKLNHTQHSLQQLFEHLINEHSSRYFACLTCQERFSTIKNHKEHNKTIHNIDEPDIRSTETNVEKESEIDESSPAKNVKKRNVKSPKLDETEESVDEEDIETNTTSKEDISDKNKRVQIKNKKRISVKSTKNGVRTLRTTRASVKQINSRLNKKRKVKSKEVKKDTEVHEDSVPKTVINSSSVFSLVNLFTYKYEKIYDHASDSIKDANCGKFDAVFDKDFYVRTVSNIKENLLFHLDGKLNRNIQSENRISNFEHHDVEPKNPPDNFGCDLSLNAVTPVATLLATSHYEDLDDQIEYASKATKKNPKKDKNLKYKYTNRKFNTKYLDKSDHSDLTCLDMWTQLKIKERQSENIVKSIPKQQAKEKIKELNTILDKRGPFEDLKVEAYEECLKSRRGDSKDAQKEVNFIIEDLLSNVFTTIDNKNAIDVKPILDSSSNFELPNYLSLQMSPNKNVVKLDKTDKTTMICVSDETATNVELTGEWARPRIYICATCAQKLPNLKALEEHKNNSHPHIWSTHYEFVGKQSEFYRHLGIPGLGKVGVIEMTPSVKVWQRSDARMCSKCAKQCHNLGDLHRHILECGGDWTWMLARKKCKYRPYGVKSKRRRQRGYKRQCNPDISRAPRERRTKSTQVGPRVKPSDAETIERMLANLPAKRIRKVISMRDGIQGPRKPYLRGKLNQSSNHHSDQRIKTRISQTTNQALKNTLKRSLVRNLRNRLKVEYTEKEHDDHEETEKMNRKKRTMSRVLGSKILDSNSTLATRRRLVTAMQNNMIRRTRLRSKMAENAENRRSPRVKDSDKPKEEPPKIEEIIVEKDEKKTDKVPEKKSTSKRILSLLTSRSVRKQKQDEPKVLEDVTIKRRKIKPGDRRFKTNNQTIKTDDTEKKVDNLSTIINAVATNTIDQLETPLSTLIRKKTNNLVKHVKSFKKDFKTKNKIHNKLTEKSVTSKLIRTLSMRGTKRKKLPKESVVIEKTTEEELVDVLNNSNNTDPKNGEANVEESAVVSVECKEIKEKSNSDETMPTLEKIVPVENPEAVENIPVLSPVSTSPTEEITSKIDVENIPLPTNETENKADEPTKTIEPEKSIDTENVALCEIKKEPCSVLTKFKNKFKRSGKGLNDCIAMLRCKLEKKAEPSLALDKSNLFILNACENRGPVIVETEKLIENNQSDKTEIAPKIVVTETEPEVTETVPKREHKTVLEVPVFTKRVPTPEAPKEPEENQTTNDFLLNNQLTSVLDEAMKNCLLECVKTKCEELKNGIKSGKPRKIGSIRRRKKKESKQPKSLNDAFIANTENIIEPKPIPEHSSDDDIPLSTLVQPIKIKLPKKRGRPKTIKFAPLILNQVQSPEILQDKIEQHVDLDNSMNNKIESIQKEIAEKKVDSIDEETVEQIVEAVVERSNVPLEEERTAPELKAAEKTSEEIEISDERTTEQIVENNISSSKEASEPSSKTTVEDELNALSDLLQKDDTAPVTIEREPSASDTTPNTNESKDTTPKELFNRESLNIIPLQMMNIEDEQSEILLNKTLNSEQIENVDSGKENTVEKTKGRNKKLKKGKIFNGNRKSNDEGEQEEIKKVRGRKRKSKIDVVKEGDAQTISSSDTKQELTLNDSTKDLGSEAMKNTSKSLNSTIDDTIESVIKSYTVSDFECGEWNKTIKRRGRKKKPKVESKDTADKITKKLESGEDISEIPLSKLIKKTETQRRKSRTRNELVDNKNVSKDTPEIIENEEHKVDDKSDNTEIAKDVELEKVSKLNTESETKGKNRRTKRLKCDTVENETLSKTEDKNLNLSKDLETTKRRKSKAINYNEYSDDTVEELSEKEPENLEINTDLSNKKPRKETIEKSTSDAQSDTIKARNNVTETSTVEDSTTEFKTGMKKSITEISETTEKSTPEIKSDDTVEAEEKSLTENSTSVEESAPAAKIDDTVKASKFTTNSLGNAEETNQKAKSDDGLKTRRSKIVTENSTAEEAAIKDDRMETNKIITEILRTAEVPTSRANSSDTVKARKLKSDTKNLTTVDESILVAKKEDTIKTKMITEILRTGEDSTPRAKLDDTIKAKKSKVITENWTITDENTLVTKKETIKATHSKITTETTVNLAPAAENDDTTKASKKISDENSRTVDESALEGKKEEMMKAIKLKITTETSVITDKFALETTSDMTKASQNISAKNLETADESPEIKSANTNARQKITTDNSETFEKSTQETKPNTNQERPNTTDLNQDLPKQKNRRKSKPRNIETNDPNTDLPNLDTVKRRSKSQLNCTENIDEPKEIIPEKEIYSEKSLRKKQQINYNESEQEIEEVVENTETKKRRGRRKKIDLINPADKPDLKTGSNDIQSLDGKDLKSPDTCEVRSGLEAEINLDLDSSVDLGKKKERGRKKTKAFSFSNAEEEKDISEINPEFESINQETSIAPLTSTETEISVNKVPPQSENISEKPQDVLHANSVPQTFVIPQTNLDVPQIIPALQIKKGKCKKKSLSEITDLLTINADILKSEIKKYDQTKDSKSSTEQLVLKNLIGSEWIGSPVLDKIEPVSVPTGVQSENETKEENKLVSTVVENKLAKTVIDLNILNPTLFSNLTLSETEKEIYQKPEMEKIKKDKIKQSVPHLFQGVSDESPLNLVVTENMDSKIDNNSTVLKDLLESLDLVSKVPGIPQNVQKKKRGRPKVSKPDLSINLDRSFDSPIVLSPEVQGENLEPKKGRGRRKQSKPDLFQDLNKPFESPIVLSPEVQGENLESKKGRSRRKQSKSDLSEDLNKSFDSSVEISPEVREGENLTPKKGRGRRKHSKPDLSEDFNKSLEGSIDLQLSPEVHGENLDSLDKKHSKADFSEDLDKSFESPIALSLEVQVENVESKKDDDKINQVKPNLPKELEKSIESPFDFDLSPEVQEILDYKKSKSRKKRSKPDLSENLDMPLRSPIDFELNSEVQNLEFKKGRGRRKQSKSDIEKSFDSPTEFELSPEVREAIENFVCRKGRRKHKSSSSGDRTTSSESPNESDSNIRPENLDIKNGRKSSNLMDNSENQLKTQNIQEIPLVDFAVEKEIENQSPKENLPENIQSAMSEESLIVPETSPQVKKRGRKKSKPDLMVGPNIVNSEVLEFSELTPESLQAKKRGRRKSRPDLSEDLIKSPIELNSVGLLDTPKPSEVLLDVPEKQEYKSPSELSEDLKSFVSPEILLENTEIKKKRVRKPRINLTEDLKLFENLSENLTSEPELNQEPKKRSRKKSKPITEDPKLGTLPSEELSPLLSEYELNEEPKKRGRKKSKPDLAEEFKSSEISTLETENKSDAPEIKNKNSFTNLTELFDGALLDLNPTVALTNISELLPEFSETKKISDQSLDLVEEINNSEILRNQLEPMKNREKEQPNPDLLEKLPILSENILNPILPDQANLVLNSKAEQEIVSELLTPKKRGRKKTIKPDLNDIFNPSEQDQDLNSSEKVSSETLSENLEIKKGRGRRKQINPDLAVDINSSDQDLNSSEELTETVSEIIGIKKGRGRKKQINPDLPVDMNSSDQDLNSSEELTETVSEIIGIKKGRGRKKQINLDLPVDMNSSDQDLNSSEELTETVSEIIGIKKGRGRKKQINPDLVDVILNPVEQNQDLNSSEQELSESVLEIVGIKKGRGRKKQIKPDLTEDLLNPSDQDQDLNSSEQELSETVSEIKKGRVRSKQVNLDLADDVLNPTDQDLNSSELEPSEMIGIKISRGRKKQINPNLEDGILNRSDQDQYLNSSETISEYVGIKKGRGRKKQVNPDLTEDLLNSSDRDQDLNSSEQDLSEIVSEHLEIKKDKSRRKQINPDLADDNPSGQDLNSLEQEHREIIGIKISRGRKKQINPGLEDGILNPSDQDQDLNSSGQELSEIIGIKISRSRNKKINPDLETSILNSSDQDQDLNSSEQDLSEILSENLEIKKGRGGRKKINPDLTDDIFNPSVHNQDLNSSEQELSETISENVEIKKGRGRRKQINPALLNPDQNQDLYLLQPPQESDILGIKKGRGRKKSKPDLAELINPNLVNPVLNQNNLDLNTEISDARFLETIEIKKGRGRKKSKPDLPELVNTDLVNPVLTQDNLDLNTEISDKTFLEIVEIKKGRGRRKSRPDLPELINPNPVNPDVVNPDLNQDNQDLNAEISDQPFLEILEIKKGRGRKKSKPDLPELINPDLGNPVLNLENQYLNTKISDDGFLENLEIKKGRDLKKQFKPDQELVNPVLNQANLDLNTEISDEKLLEILEFKKDGARKKKSKPDLEVNPNLANPDLVKSVLNQASLDYNTEILDEKLEILHIKKGRGRKNQSKPDLEINPDLISPVLNQANLDLNTEILEDKLEILQIKKSRGRKKQLKSDLEMNLHLVNPVLNQDNLDLNTEMSDDKFLDILEIKKGRGRKKQSKPDVEVNPDISDQDNLDLNLIPQETIEKKGRGRRKISKPDIYDFNLSDQDLTDLNPEVQDLDLCLTGLQELSDTSEIVKKGRGRRKKSKADFSQDFNRLDQDNLDLSFTEEFSDTSEIVNSKKDRCRRKLSRPDLGEDLIKPVLATQDNLGLNLEVPEEFGIEIETNKTRKRQSKPDLSKDLINPVIPNQDNPDLSETFVPENVESKKDTRKEPNIADFINPNLDPENLDLITRGLLQEFSEIVPKKNRQKQINPYQNDLLNSDMTDEDNLDLNNEILQEFSENVPEILESKKCTSKSKPDLNEDLINPDITVQDNDFNPAKVVPEYSVPEIVQTKKGRKKSKSDLNQDLHNPQIPDQYNFNPSLSVPEYSEPEIIQSKKGRRKSKPDIKQDLLNPEIPDQDNFNPSLSVPGYSVPEIVQSKKGRRKSKPDLNQDLLDPEIPDKNNAPVMSEYSVPEYLQSKKDPETVDFKRNKKSNPDLTDFNFEVTDQNNLNLNSETVSQVKKKRGRKKRPKSELTDPVNLGLNPELPDGNLEIKKGKTKRKHSKPVVIVTQSESESLDESNLDNPETEKRIKNRHKSKTELPEDLQGSFDSLVNLGINPTDVLSEFNDDLGGSFDSLVNLDFNPDEESEMRKGRKHNLNNAPNQFLIPEFNSSLQKIRKKRSKPDQNEISQTELSDSTDDLSDVQSDVSDAPEIKIREQNPELKIKIGDLFKKQNIQTKKIRDRKKTININESSSDLDNSDLGSNLEKSSDVSLDQIDDILPMSDTDTNSCPAINLEAVTKQTVLKISLGKPDSDSKVENLELPFEKLGHLSDNLEKKKGRGRKRAPKESTLELNSESKVLEQKKKDRKRRSKSHPEILDKESSGNGEILGNESVCPEPKKRGRKKRSKSQVEESSKVLSTCDNIESNELEETTEDTKKKGRKRRSKSLLKDENLYETEVNEQDKKQRPSEEFEEIVPSQSCPEPKIQVEANIESIEELDQVETSQTDPSRLPEINLQKPNPEDNAFEVFDEIPKTPTIQLASDDSEDEIPLSFLQKTISQTDDEILNDISENLETPSICQNLQDENNTFETDDLEKNVSELDKMEEFLDKTETTDNLETQQTEFETPKLSLKIDRKNLDFSDEFITTPDLNNTSLVITIKKKFNCNIRKPKKTRKKVVIKPIQRTIKRKEEENILCDICNKSFRSSENLMKHKRTLTHISKLSELEALESAAKQTFDENKEEEQTERIEIIEKDPSPEENKPVEVIEQIPRETFLNKNSNLKLVDIISDVLDKPVNDLKMSESVLLNKNITNSLQEEPKKYRSLGERKSFDSDSFIVPQKCPNEDFTSKPTNNQLLNTQLSLLENIIKKPNQEINYIEDSISYSSNHFDETITVRNIAEKDVFKEYPIKFNEPQIKFSHNTDIISSFIKPDGHFTHFENHAQQNFAKPVPYEESSQGDKNYKENSTRKILNRDEELFLECCSLLKSGSEISSVSKKSKQVPVQNFDNAWEQKHFQRDYSWLAQGSRVETPIGEPYVNNDWSNSNSAVSSEWLAQKAASPDQPVENNTLSKKENYSNMQFEDISADETQNTVNSAEKIKENIPLDFHNVNFTKNIEFNVDDKDKEETGDETNASAEEDGKEKKEETTDEVDEDLKRHVVTAFGGLMAKALKCRLKAVVRRSNKNKEKRTFLSALQPAITEYAIPVKKTKGDEQLPDNIPNTSESPKKIVTKGAMKVFEGLKVSIPTQNIDLKEVLKDTNKEKQKTVEPEEKTDKETKITKKNIFNSFGNKLGLRETKKKSSKKHKIQLENKEHDIYDFEESEDNSSLFKSKLVFRSARSTEDAADKAANTPSDNKSNDSESETDRYYDSISYEENSLSNESVEQEEKVTEKLKKDEKKKCMIMGRIFKNASKPKLEDKIPEIRDISSEENSKLVENYLESYSSVDNVESTIEGDVPNANLTIINSVNKMSQNEMDMLFDKLLQDNSKKIPETEIVTIQPNEKPKVPKTKKRQRHQSDDSGSTDEFTLTGKPKSSKKHKKHIRKGPSKKKNGGIDLDEEMKECIGVAGRKSQRKCTSGKQNVLVEFWSSDESIDFAELCEEIAQEPEVTEKDIEPKIDEVKEVEIKEIDIQKQIDEIYEFEPEIEDELQTSIDLHKHKKSLKIRNEKRHSKSKDDDDFEGRKAKRKEHRKKHNSNSETSATDSLATSRRKRNAVETLYYWSSTSDDEFQDLIEVKPIREDTEDDRPMQHGWIVGDSPKKLVTMLAQAKGKKVDCESVKEQKKARVTL